MRKLFLIAIGAIMSAQMSSAGVTITGTRIIFLSDQKTVTVQLNNPLNTPALIQSWIDDGDANKIPDAKNIPFVITPPLTQIEPKKGQMLRLIANGTTALAKDRESIYWFNILDIPPTNASESDLSKINVSIRSRIKLFYRPKNLAITQEKAFELLQFKFDQPNRTLEVDNPSPYYISFQDIVLNPQVEKYTYSEPLMIAPYSKERVKLHIDFKPTSLISNLINDYGATQSYIINLEP